PVSLGEVVELWPTGLRLEAAVRPIVRVGRLTAPRALTGARAHASGAAADDACVDERDDRTPEAATGLDSPTSILCLLRPSRLLLFLRSASRRWKQRRAPSNMLGPMGLQEHQDVLKAAEERLQSLKVSL
ncbi:MAG: hypothetical protein ACON4Z_02915, partial [Planctomycetota bacterium]